MAFAGRPSGQPQIGSVARQSHVELAERTGHQYERALLYNISMLCQCVIADVVDWMLDNLIDKTRTRRGVMKKLREMGLSFKKPTKKRTVPESQRWSAELDERLRDLYTKYRTDENTMARIMEDLDDETKSKRTIINRLQHLGCFGDGDALAKKNKTKRTKKKKTSATGNNSDAADSEDEYEVAQRPDGSAYLKPKTKAKRPRKVAGSQRRAALMWLNVSTAKSLIASLTEGGLADALAWLKESFEDVVEDLQDDDVEQEDAIPLVPIAAEQREAIDNADFQQLLREFGMQEPLQEMVSERLVTLFNVDSYRYTGSDS